MSAAALDAGWPAELRGLRSYLPYQMRPRASGRLGKCPARWAGDRLYPVSAREARYHLTFGAALELLEQGRCDGIGIVLGERGTGLDGSPLCAVDLDGVLEGGQLHPAAATLVEQLATYSEVSVSGQGLHVIAAAQVPSGARRGSIDGLQVELITNGFLAITGNHWPDSPASVESRPAELGHLQGQLCPPPPPPRSRPAPGPGNDLLAQLLKQRNAPKVRRLLLDGDTTGYPSSSQAVYAAARLIAWRTREPQAIETLLRSSPLYAPRWERPATAAGLSWISLTIHRALSAHQGAP